MPLPAYPTAISFKSADLVRAASKRFPVLSQFVDYLRSNMASIDTAASLAPRWRLRPRRENRTPASCPRRSHNAFVSSVNSANFSSASSRP